MNTNIRQADESDLPDILRLYDLLSNPDDEPISLEDISNLFNKMGTYPDYKVYVTEVNGEIVGTFALLVMDNMAHGGMPSGIIEDMAVAPDWQRKGIGKKMVDFSMQYCKNVGCYKIQLSSNVKREGAHKFYEALGFERYGYAFTVNL